MLPHGQSHSEIVTVGSKNGEGAGYRRKLIELVFEEPLHPPDDVEDVPRDVVEAVHCGITSCFETDQELVALSKTRVCETMQIQIQQHKFPTYNSCRIE